MESKGRVLWIVLLASVLVTGIPGLGGGLDAAQAAGGVVRADFNGDGWADLAIGMHGKNVGEEGSAGAVVVIYGSSAGLDAFGGDGIPASQVWTQSSPGVPGGPEENDYFGTALAAGDFNNDGFSDLAIGVPGEDLEGFSNLGAVNIIYGSAQGLVAQSEEAVLPAQFLSLIEFEEMMSTENGEWAGENANTGSSLAVADFDGDGYDDLAVGIPNLKFQFREGWGYDYILNAGAVLVLYGSAAGLTGDRRQSWHQGPLRGGREEGDHFGAALAAGDFNGDGFGDLAVGVPEEDIGDFQDAGAVNVIYGSASGLTSAGNQIWHKDSPGIIDRISSHEHFGQVLTAGDFNGDGRSDLAVGVPLTDSGPAIWAGSVSVIYGSSTALTAAGNLILTQDTLFNRSVDPPESYDYFGSALAAGDFNGDGRDDLAIGVPGEDVISSRLGVRVEDAGAVNVVYGSAAGLVEGNGAVTGRRPQIWHQEKLGGLLEAGDRFGSSLTASNFGRNGFRIGIPPRFVGTADLAIGVPHEAVWSNDSNWMAKDGGAVNVIYGSILGLSVGRYPGPGASQIWMQGYDGVPGSSEANDWFGFAVY